MASNEEQAEDTPAAWPCFCWLLHLGYTILFGCGKWERFLMNSEQRIKMLCRFIPNFLQKAKTDFPILIIFFIDNRSIRSVRANQHVYRRFVWGKPFHFLYGSSSGDCVYYVFRCSAWNQQDHRLRKQILSPHFFIIPGEAKTDKSAAMPIFQTAKQLSSETPISAYCHPFFADAIFRHAWKTAHKTDARLCFGRTGLHQVFFGVFAPKGSKYYRAPGAAQLHPLFWWRSLCCVFLLRSFIHILRNPVRRGVFHFLRARSRL